MAGEITNKYTEFIEKNGMHKVRNIIYDQIVGEIKKDKSALLSYKDAWYSNGCLKEILDFLTVGKITKDLKFVHYEHDNTYEIQNSDGLLVGSIKKQRVGKWMHWCILPEENVELSYGWLKEISCFIITRYNKQKSK